MLVFLHEMLLKVPTPLIWSLKPYGLAVPSSLIQNSSLVLLYGEGGGGGGQIPHV